jgi:hypothetical protein
MSKSELIKELTNLNINPKFYSLDEGLKEDAINIKKTPENFICCILSGKGKDL